jgi:serine/threonine-protein kinase
MAEVFEARRVGTGELAGIERSVALKRLRPEMAADRREVTRLVEEARILSRLNHPNIVSLYEAGYEDGELFVALELVDGVSLARLVAAARGSARPLGAEIAASVGAQVAAALACAHAFCDETGAPAGLIHRDVSPHNLLVDRRGLVKLADFGIARPLARSAATTRDALGKLPYMAPEQLRGAAYDHRVDIHALGVVLFEVACGTPPYEGESDGEVISRIVEGRPASSHRLRELSEPLATLVEAMIATDPSARPGDAGQLAAALAGLCDQRMAVSRLAEAVERELARPQDGGSPSERRTRVLGRRLSLHR